MGFTSSIEFNKKLALAIGWKSSEIGTEVRDTAVFIHSNANRIFWQRFDYRDEVIAFRIAAKYGCFPWKVNERWLSVPWGVSYTTPQEAIAHAVIGMK